MAQFVSAIFDGPKMSELSWNLRGDPVFWAYLREHYSTVELPYPPLRLEQGIMGIFLELTGEPPRPRGQHFARQFQQPSGMSSGMLSDDFWLRAIPYLSQRLERKNRELADG